MSACRCLGVMVFQGFSVSAYQRVGISLVGVTANQRPGVLLSNGMPEAAARNWAMGIVSQLGEMDAVGQPGEMGAVG